MSRTTFSTELHPRVVLAAARAAVAERRVVRAVRRWFKHAGATPPVDVRERIAWEQRERSLHGHIIVAAGLDMEARADHAAAQRAVHRARAKRRATPVNREWQP